MTLLNDVITFTDPVKIGNSSNAANIVVLCITGVVLISGIILGIILKNWKIKWFNWFFIKNII